MKWYVYFTDEHGVYRCHCFEDNEQEATGYAELVNGVAKYCY